MFDYINRALRQELPPRPSLSDQLTILNIPSDITKVDIGRTDNQNFLEKTRQYQSSGQSVCIIREGTPVMILPNPSTEPLDRWRDNVLITEQAFDTPDWIPALTQLSSVLQKLDQIPPEELEQLVQRSPCYLGSFFEKPSFFCIKKYMDVLPQDGQEGLNIALENINQILLAK